MYSVYKPCPRPAAVGAAGEGTELVNHVKTDKAKQRG